MKKIIGAALLGTMAAGVFAVDAKIALNYRSRLDAFSQVTTDDDGDKSTVRNWMNWDGYAGTSSDNFDFRLDGENAGARLTWAINTADGSINKGKQYSGWMKFNAGPGVLTLETGYWADGYADGAYRVKKDVDAVNAEGLDFERFKLGTIFSKTAPALQGLSFADDLNFGGNVSGFANYKFNVNDDISLNFTVGGVKNDSFDTVVDGDTTTNWKSALASRIQFNMKNAVNAELIYKNAHSQDDSLTHTFALYVMPQVMDALTLNVGGAMEVYGGDTDYTDWAVDLRLRYQVMNPLSVTLFTNISGTNLDAGRKISNGIVGYDANQSNYGKAGYATSSYFKTAMWNQLGLRYVVNDALAATLNVGLITPLAKVDGDDNSYTPEWRVVPGVQVFADKNASIWAAVALSGAKVEDKNVFAVNIPVIFRVKM